MNKSLLFYFLFVFSLITSCQQKNVEVIKVEILGEGKALNLETLDFKEDVLRLYSKISEIDSLEALFEVYKRKKPFLIEDLKFRAKRIEALGVSIPDFSYGYVFEGVEKDSLAKLHGIYFKGIKALTNMDKKIVAITAHSSYNDKNARDAKLDSLRAKYGNPILEVNVSAALSSQNSYTWVTKNRIIEVNTSRGFKIDVNTSAEVKEQTTYELNLLLVDNAELKTLVKAHRNYYDDDYQRTDTPELAESEFLPKLINIKTYFIGNSNLYTIKEE